MNAFKQILAFSLVLGGLTFGAFGEGGRPDSYLYWMLPVEENPYVDEFSFAKLRVDNTQTYVDLSGTDLNSWYPAVAAGDDGKSTSDYWANLGSFAGDGYRYVLELYLDDGADGKLVGKSGSISYADLAGYLAADPIGDPTRNPSSPFTAWQVVPEPTSGLLVLLGVAGLALRRKRA